jgi:lipid-binding SYLF domain-containing protein
MTTSLPGSSGAAARWSAARRALLALAAAALLPAAPAAVAGPREEARVLEATQVLEDAQRMPDQWAPDWLLRRAQGIAVLPTVVKVGLGLGGRGGKGVLVVRDAQGRWSNPSFVTLGGGSIGWQAGVETADIILVFTTRKSIEGVTGGKVTLGADASVAVGPVGRQVSGATAIGLDSEVYSYSRAKGLFGGIALDGTAITIDHRANAAYYERPGVLPSDIFAPTAPAAPEAAQRLVAAVQAMTRAGDTSGQQPASAPTPPAGTPPPAAGSDGRGLESGGATTYPLAPPSPAPKTP